VTRGGHCCMMTKGKLFLDTVTACAPSFATGCLGHPGPACRGKFDFLFNYYRYPLMTPMVYVMITIVDLCTPMMLRAISHERSEGLRFTPANHHQKPNAAFGGSVNLWVRRVSLAVARSTSNPLPLYEENAKKRFLALPAFCVGLALGGCGPAYVADPLPTTLEIQSSDAGAYPTNYEDIVKQYYAKRLKDPYSAQYGHITSPRKEFYDVITSDSKVRRFGYLVCVTLNAKNSYGAYTGFKTNGIIIRDGVVVRERDQDVYNSILRGAGLRERPGVPGCRY